MIHKKHSKHGYQLTESTTIPIKAYADDVCKMCHDRQKLKELLQLTATYCGQRGVALNQKKTYLYSINDITAPLTCYINVISLYVTNTNAANASTLPLIHLPYINVVNHLK